MIGTRYGDAFDVDPDWPLYRVVPPPPLLSPCLLCYVPCLAHVKVCGLAMGGGSEAHPARCLYVLPLSCKRCHTFRCAHLTYNPCSSSTSSTRCVVRCSVAWCLAVWHAVQWVCLVCRCAGPHRVGGSQRSRRHVCEAVLCVWPLASHHWCGSTCSVLRPVCSMYQLVEMRGHG